LATSPLTVLSCTGNAPLVDRAPNGSFGPYGCQGDVALVSSCYYSLAMTGRRLSAVVILLVVGWLVPLAYASPPDQTWIPGITDNADHDDAVILVTSAVGAVATVITVDATSIACVMAPLMLAPELPPSPESAPYRLRAPPSA